MKGDSIIKKSLYLIGTSLAASLFLFSGCKPRQSTFSKNNPVPVEQAGKGYYPGAQVSYPYYGSLPYIVGSADAITIASIVKDHGIITLYDGTDYYDYRLYTLKSERSFKPGLGNGEEFQVMVNNFAERKVLSQRGLYFLSERSDKYQFNLISPEQGDLPIEKDKILLKEYTKVFFPEQGENIPVKKAIEEIENIIQ